MEGLATLYCEFLREVSHYLRSPLGVAMGVVDDQLKGYACSREDLKAATDSLNKVRSMLDLFKLLGFSTNRPQTIYLKDFLGARESACFNHELECTLLHLSETAETFIDPAVLDNVLGVVSLILQQNGYSGFALETLSTTDLADQQQKTVIHIYGTHIRVISDDQSKSEWKSDACSVLEQERLRYLVWELVRINCLQHRLDCCQYQDSEKNTHFRLTFL